jgi:APA family basic amino acid/polyamine antiporter
MTGSTTPAPALRRTLGLPLLTLYGLGTTIGGGIYVLIGSVAERAGLFALVSFMIAAVLIGFTALSYAELSSRFPVSGGSAVFVSRGFGRERLGLVVGILVVIAAIITASVLARGFASYLQVLLDVPTWISILCVLVVIGLLAAWGIGESVVAASIVTILEIAGLMIVIWAGSDAFSDFPYRWDAFVPPPNWHAWAGIMGGTIIAFFAFIGFEDMVNVAEEVKDAERVLPCAIVVTLTLTTVLYLAVAYVTLATVPLDVLSRSEAPLSLVAGEHSHRLAELLAFIGTLAVLNGALIQIIMAARVLYGMSRQGWIHNRLGRVYARTQTPLAATALVTVAIALLALSFPVDILATLTSLMVLLIGALVNGALLHMKMTAKITDGIRLPKVVPLIGMVSNACFAILIVADLLTSNLF